MKSVTLRNHANYVIICMNSRVVYPWWQQFILPQLISVNLTRYFRINAHSSSFTLQISPLASPIVVTMVTMLDVNRGCWVARRLLCWRYVCVCVCLRVSVLWCNVRTRCMVGLETMWATRHDNPKPCPHIYRACWLMSAGPLKAEPSEECSGALQNTQRHSGTHVFFYCEKEHCPG